MKIEEGKYYKANYTVDNIEDNILTGIVLEKEKIDWNSIRTQAAIAAMQGFIKHSKNEFDSVEDAIKWMKIVSHNSITMADALIAELKKGE